MKRSFLFTAALLESRWPGKGFCASGGVSYPMCSLMPRFRTRMGRRWRALHGFGYAAFIADTIYTKMGFSLAGQKFRPGNFARALRLCWRAIAIVGKHCINEGFLLKDATEDIEKLRAVGRQLAALDQGLDVGTVSALF